jgi:structural toxin protein (hemagglutinin/hemolysin) RtxA
MYKISFYVPAEYAEGVKNAMFAAGAGKLGAYQNCSWQTLGEGQFMPLSGHHAFIGEENQLEKVAEYKVEMVCTADCIHAVIQAFKKAHPYEEPAYQVVRMENF